MRISTGKNWRNFSHKRLIFKFAFETVVCPEVPLVSCANIVWTVCQSGPTLLESEQKSQDRESLYRDPLRRVNRGRHSGSRRFPQAIHDGWLGWRMIQRFSCPLGRFYFFTTRFTIVHLLFDNVNIDSITSFAGHAA